MKPTISLFTDEAEVLELLSCLQPAAHAQQMLEVLKTSASSRRKSQRGWKSYPDDSQDSQGSTHLQSLRP